VGFDGDDEGFAGGRGKVEEVEGDAMKRWIKVVEVIREVKPNVWKVRVRREEEHNLLKASLQTTLSVP
jgi:hypothetical protein